MSDKMMNNEFRLPVIVEDSDVVDSSNMILMDCGEEWIADYAAHAINQHDILTNRVKVLEEELFEANQERPPVENGKNRYGVDISYFRNVINRELNRSLADFKPDELARVFARLSVTADSQVIFEDEFQSRKALEADNG